MQIVAGILLLGLLFGGGSSGDVALTTEPEVLISEPNVTTATQLLVSLPEPASKPSVAIYRIEDKTGQFRSDDMNRSTVLSQGATEMMITALHRSRQFTVLDRINFQDVMNEQNLRAQNRLAPGTGPDVGAITGADYLVRGAVTEYQIIEDSGGFGLRVGGQGGYTEQARASAAIDIRLTDATTGEIVWSKSLKSEIYGEKIGIQVFSFMGENVVELETGKGKQEVINLVLRTLIEEAVYKMAMHFQDLQSQ